MEEYQERLNTERALLWWLVSLASAFLIHSLLPDYEQREWGGQRIWVHISVFALLGSIFLRQRFQSEEFYFSVWSKTLLFLRHWGIFVSLISLFIHKLYTLLLVRDVLTQSVLLACMSLIGLLVSTPYQKKELMIFALKRIRDLTALTYVGAALHKLNTDFLYSSESCALHGLDVTLELINWSWLNSLRMEYPWFTSFVQYCDVWLKTPYIIGIIIILTEVLLAFGLWKSKAWVWPLGLFFHLPLTLTIAPAFAGVMLSGYCAYTLVISLTFKPKGFMRFLPQNRILLIFSLLLLWIAYLPGGQWIKVIMMIMIAYWGWSRLNLTKKSQKSLIHGIRHESSGVEIWKKRTLMMLSYGYALHLLSPYLGFEVQHSGAMLSNIRIDPSCFNSLLMPSIGWDPYIRIDDAQFGQVERPHKVKILKNQLWGWAAMNSMRRNWCSPITRPLSMKGSWYGQSFHIEDLCATEGLKELEQIAPIQTALPKGWQRLQKNLSRHCHQACVH